MKKMIMLSLVAGLALGITGCASSGKDGENPVVAWKADRAAVEFKSSVSIPAVAGMINPVGNTLAVPYAVVVSSVDKEYAVNEGRRVYLAVQNDIKAGAKFADIKKNMPKADLDAYVAYQKYAVNRNYDGVMAQIEKIAKQIADQSVIVAGLLAKAKADPSFKALAGFAAVKEAKNLANDVDTLKSQISSATTGIGLWRGLVNQDKAAREFMKKYPVK